MSLNIALAGNPNSGKTTMFNALTGSSQYVGNWPGVTVEKKEGKYRGNKDVIIQDLPGIYSLSPYTMEEVVSRNYLVNDHPDAIINIIDASNIERNLYLTTQLTEIGIPVVVVLNMMDVVQKNGDKIDIAKLEEKLGCEVLEASALKGFGINEAAEKAIALAKSNAKATPKHKFSPEVEAVLTKIETLIRSSVSGKNARWYAVKFFERDEKVREQVKLSADIQEQIEHLTAACEEKLDDSSEAIIISERYSYISEIIRTALKKNRSNLPISDRIDAIVTHRIFALPIFAVAMFFVYYISISTVGTAMTDWVNGPLFEEMVPEAIGSLLTSMNVAPWMESLVLDGIVAGVGAVLGFLPQMAVLFLCLALLEDCGYMARVAFIMDRVFRRFGLSGKSFIPMLVSTGCGVPGIMASRTIESDNDRRMTVMTTTFVPCGAKLPIIALIAGALFGGAAWVATSAYFIGVLAIIFSGIVLKKTKMFAGDPAPFVMELPAYHFPGLKGIARTTWNRTWAFVKKAGSIVLLATVLIWFLSSFNFQLQMVEEDASMLASIGRVIAPIFIPLGWGDWRTAVATVTGLIAKENVVGTLGILFGVAEVAEDGAEYWPAFATTFTAVAGYSFLVFNLLCAPCFAAIGAIRREMMSAKWTWFAIGYQCLLAYCAALVIYQLGTFFTLGTFGVGTVVAIALVLLAIYLLLRKPYSEPLQSKLSAAQI